MHEESGAQQVETRLLLPRDGPEHQYDEWVIVQSYKLCLILGNRCVMRPEVLGIGLVTSDHRQSLSVSHTHNAAAHLQEETILVQQVVLRGHFLGDIVIKVVQ